MIKYGRISWSNNPRKSFSYKIILSNYVKNIFWTVKLSIGLIFDFNCFYDLFSRKAYVPRARERKTSKISNKTLCAIIVLTVNEIHNNGFGTKKRIRNRILVENYCFDIFNTSRKLYFRSIVFYGVFKQRVSAKRRLTCVFIV